MSWFSEIADKAENLLNKIDQKTANVLNNSNDLIANKINDKNEFIIPTINNSLSNSQSLPQLKSIFVSSDPESEFDKSSFKYGHSRDNSTASYHGITMKDTTNLNKSKLVSKPIDDGQLFDYLNTKQNDPNLSLNSYLTVGNFEKSNNKSIRLNESLNTNQSFVSNDNEPIEQESLNNEQSQSKAIQNILKEEKLKLNELKTEYKKHTENLNNEILFLKDKLNEHLVKGNQQIELDNLRQQLKIEKTNKEKFEKEIAILSTSFKVLKNEFEEYKVRAQRTLQSKESQIDQLQNSVKDNQMSDSKLEEYRDLESINQHLQQELQEIKIKYSKLKQDTDELINERINELENKFKQSQYELNNVRTIRTQLEEELKNLRIELEQSKSNLNRINQEKLIELNAKQQQIDELNNELINLKDNKWSQQGIPQDLELKIKNLTENLLNKQTLVEHLKREKNSLVLQLEESKRQMCNLQSKNSNYYINFKDGLSERNMSQDSLDNSYNSPVARRVVKRAYSQFDQFRFVLIIFFY